MVTLSDKASKYQDAMATETPFQPLDGVKTVGERREHYEEMLDPNLESGDIEPEIDVDVDSTGD